MSDGTRSPMHGRDHLPGGSDPIPNLAAIHFARMTFSTVIPSGSFHAVTFDHFYTDSPNLCATVPNGTAGDTGFEIYESCSFVYELKAEWIGGLWGSYIRAIGFESGGGDFSPPIDDLNTVATQAPLYSSSGKSIHQTGAGFGHLGISGIHIDASQASGSDQQINSTSSLVVVFFSQPDSVTTVY